MCLKLLPHGLIGLFVAGMFSATMSSLSTSYNMIAGILTKDIIGTVFIKNASENAGVSCTFTSETNDNAQNLKIGNKITIKGVIRSGAGYDEDLELYEDVILEKCDVLHN